MRSVFNLSTPQHWKAYSHPIRQKLLLLLHEKEMTNAELAAEIGVPAGHLHFHTRQLLSAGLIEIVGIRMKGPITEKLYRATAKRFASEHVPAGVGLPLEPSFEIGLDLYRRRGLGVNDGPCTASCLMIPMNRRTAERYMERIEEIQRDLIGQSESSGDSDDELYALTLIMHRLAKDQPKLATNLNGEDNEVDEQQK
jgi:DNA-binding transcriptional ArsR family regulator